MRRFEWNDWNEAKLAAHGLSPAEVEAAFDRVAEQIERADGSFKTLAALPSGRVVRVIWRYDREDAGIPDVFGEVADPPVFVITAY